MNLAGQRAIARASKNMPVSFVAFDLLWLDGHDTTGLPLEERRELLELVIEHDHRLQVTTHVEGDGVAFTEPRGARPRGRDGQATGSPYLPGRRTRLAQDQAHEHAGLRGPGLDPGQGRPRGSFGALLVGAIVDGDACAGSVRSVSGSPSACSRT